MSARNRSKSLSVQGFLTVIFLLVGLLVCNGIILADNVADDDEIIVALETAYQREIGYAQYIAGFEMLLNQSTR